MNIEVTLQIYSFKKYIYSKQIEKDLKSNSLILEKPFERMVFFCLYFFRFKVIFLN
jgi:hypothetical protein